MTKSELVASLRDACPGEIASKAAATRVVDALIEIFSEAMENHGDKKEKVDDLIQLPGFGKLGELF